MLACRFVGRRVKPEKLLRSSSLSRPVDTTLVAVGRIARGGDAGLGERQGNPFDHGQMRVPLDPRTRRRRF